MLRSVFNRLFKFDFKSGRKRGDDGRKDFLRGLGLHSRDYDNYDFCETFFAPAQANNNS
jgi:hypothetical protein